MCGIFGARKFNQFESLYGRNKDRGFFSHGFLFTKKNGSMFIRKGEGKYDPEAMIQNMIYFQVIHKHRRHPLENLQLRHHILLSTVILQLLITVFQKITISQRKNITSRRRRQQLIVRSSRGYLSICILGMMLKLFKRHAIS